MRDVCHVGLAMSLENQRAGRLEAGSFPLLAASLAIHPEGFSLAGAFPSSKKHLPRSRPCPLPPGLPRELPGELAPGGLGREGYVPGVGMSRQDPPFHHVKPVRPRNKDTFTSGVASSQPRPQAADPHKSSPTPSSVRRNGKPLTFKGTALPIAPIIPDCPVLGGVGGLLHPLSQNALLPHHQRIGQRSQVSNPQRPPQP